MRSARNQKFVWTAHHDCALVDSVLALGDKLADPIRSYPRTKFWAAVSDELHATRGLARNSRQCRDRFNLLFSRELLVPMNVVRSSSSTSVTSNDISGASASASTSGGGGGGSSSSTGGAIESNSIESVLEARLQMCVQRFRFGNGRSLELNAAPTTVGPNILNLESPPPPPRTGALHEVIHPTDLPTEQVPTSHPEPRFADLALIHSQLRHMHAALDVLTTEVTDLKSQVTELQHNIGIIKQESGKEH
ncbi:LADA_0G02674g1_1 [Lachancea dasiensis]|uniref:LADA_0G02674g1_1 n=1 Tax=Lachancea dasiensis TaxID=1072105 RepID=A0A1G4JRJ9_9SACH|nr:LADA_0G02674g1_1 [Lachancea dasiensis]